MPFFMVSTMAIFQVLSFHLLLFFFFMFLNILLIHIWCWNVCLGFRYVLFYFLLYLWSTVHVYNIKCLTVKAKYASQSSVVWYWYYDLFCTTDNKSPDHWLLYEYEIASASRKTYDHFNTVMSNMVPWSDRNSILQLQFANTVNAIKEKETLLNCMWWRRVRREKVAIYWLFFGFI